MILVDIPTCKKQTGGILFDNQYLPTNSQAVTIRTMQLEDISSINLMHDRLSKESLNYRYFTSYKPTLEAIREQAHLSKSRGTAFVAVSQGPAKEIVGLAYYIFTPDDVHVAEPAVLIEDRFQGQGLGRALMERLVGEAQDQGVTCFHLYVSPGNQRILQVLEQSGLPLERYYRDGILEIWQSLGIGQCMPI